MKVGHALVVGAAGALGLAGAGALLVPAHAASVQVTSVGWWTSSAAPPTPPSGGIAVSNDPTGVSVAAVKLDVGGGATNATLKLVEAANQVDSLASMQVCGAASSWQSASGGSLATAPADTCGTANLLLAHQADGSWTADLGALLNGRTGTVSVIIKPVTTTPAPFQVSFEKPTVDGVAVDPPSDASTDPGTAEAPAVPATAAAAASSPASSPAFGSSATPTFASTPSFTPPASDATTPTSAAASDAGGLSAESSAAPAGGQFKANLGAQNASSNHRATRGGAIGVFFLALLIGAAAAAFSWAKAAGLLELSSLRARVAR
jgi:hypothetical protein